jgi:hypothetical protein
MPRKPFPPDVIKQARDVAVAWKEIEAPMFFGPVSATALRENINASSTLQAQISVLEIQLAELCNQRDASNKSLWEKVKRVRAGVKASYGDDSQQYKMISGTGRNGPKSAAR